MGIPPPPELPKNTAAPWINIPTSVYQEDMKKLLNNQTNSDVQFILGSIIYYAHRLVITIIVCTLIWFQLLSYIGNRPVVSF